MIRKPTTLILGAGASCPYGFPLGAELVAQALLLKPELRPIEDTARISSFGVDLDDYKSFRDELRGSLAISIDRFLETRPDYRTIGKRVIAGLLIPHEKPSAVRIGVQSGWYDYLVDLLHATEIDSWQKNQLNIVTFNYDRSLEYALCVMLKARYQLHEKEAIDLAGGIPIVHVYGKLGELSFEESPDGSARNYAPFATPATVSIAASGISIVDESEDDSPEISGSRDLISLSEQIIFLGFGYDQTNVRRLKLGQFMNDNAQVYGTLMGITPSEYMATIRPLFTELRNRAQVFIDERLKSQRDFESDVLEWIRKHRNLFM